MQDKYLETELVFPRDSDEPEFTRVTKQIHDKNGISIGMAHSNQLLDSRLYEVDYSNDQRVVLAANLIAQCTFARIDDKGNRHVIFSEIIDHRITGKEVKPENAYIISKRKVDTTIGHEILLLSKDGSTTWEALEDIKE